MSIHRPLRSLHHLWQPAPMFGLVVVAICWSGLAYQLSAERTRTVEAAIDRGNGLARLFEENTIRLIKDLDRTLLLLRLANEKNRENFVLRDWTEGTSLLGDLTIQASVIGPDGYMKGSTTDYKEAPLYLGDREHFKAQLDTKSDELYISKPVVGRASGKLSIQLSRRLRQADGSFGGVIVASIDPAFVQAFHRSLNLGPHSGLDLWGLDGVMRASYGFSAQNTDITIPKLPADAPARAPDR